MSEPEYCVWKGRSYKLRVLGERVMFWDSAEGHDLHGKIGLVEGVTFHELNEGSLQSLKVTGFRSTVSNNWLVDAPPENFTPPEIEEWLRG